MADPDDTVMTKTCTKCGATKPVTAFPPDKEAKGGYRHQCRICRNAQKRTRYALNPEPRRQANRQRRHTHIDYYRALSRQRYRRNREIIITRERTRYALHRQAINAVRRQRRVQRHAQILIQKRLYHARNRQLIYAREQAKRLAYPERYASYKAKRLAQLRMHPAQALCKLTAQDWRDILAAFASHCAYCDRTMTRLTQDHITPLSKGGSHTKSNIVPACRSCNSKKHTGPPLKPVQPLLL
jgi:5-methylcytosine-specific restriction endonuclease McrA